MISRKANKLPIYKINRIKKELVPSPMAENPSEVSCDSPPPKCKLRKLIVWKSLDGF